nr:immunoglobulin heavy chain junction region [Mus musculus]
CAKPNYGSSYNWYFDVW